MRLCIPFLVSFFGCQTTPPPPAAAIIKKPAVKLEMPALPTYPEFSDPMEIGCDQFPKLAMLACLYPDHEVPFPYCELKDEYALHGIIPFALCTGDAEILFSHMSYARGKYKPSTIGLMLRTIDKMKKAKSKTFARPLVYTKGLEGNKAWDMIYSIYIEHVISGKLSDPMKVIISEQAAREPSCLFFQFMNDLVSNNFENSTRLSLDSKAVCVYHKRFDSDAIKIERYYVQNLIRKASK
jgi:hypothetical protein